MIDFMRNKIVGVEQKDEEYLIARGTLSDDIYEMRLTVTMRLADRTITALEGGLDRFTTPECPAADDFLDEAVGLRVDDEDFPRRVHRTIWRHSCQHYASLLIDCGECLSQAADILNRPDAPAKASESTKEAAPTQAAPAKPKPKPAGKRKAYQRKDRGFLLDLHVHTAPASVCSSAPVDELIKEAKRIGLDGLCLTDHNHVWDKAEVEALSKKHGLVVLRGNEITTDQGDMLVFGLERDIKGIIPLTQLREYVDQADGFMIAAHPFRGFLTFGVGKLGLTVDQAKERELFKLVDGIEIRNGKVTEDENSFAEKVAAALNLPGPGGSDAHQVDEVGAHAVLFEEPIKTEQDLIAALRRGRFQVTSLKTD